MPVCQRAQSYVPFYPHIDRVHAFVADKRLIEERIAMSAKPELRSQVGLIRAMFIPRSLI